VDVELGLLDGPSRPRKLSSSAFERSRTLSRRVTRGSVPPPVVVDPNAVEPVVPIISVGGGVVVLVPPPVMFTQTLHLRWSSAPHTNPSCR